MVNLRCSKCGNSSGFLIETSDGRTLEVKATISQDRILKPVYVTCTYCNTQWNHAPLALANPVDPFAKRVLH
jgi:ssDNA-binding Zn-finger/Zn-ribbon topoisomerase 1